MTTSEAFKYYREKRGLGSDEAAQILHISDLTYIEIEDGIVTPSDKLIEEFCKMCSLPLEAFQMLTLTEDKVVERKKELFKDVKPAIDALIKEFF